MSFINRVSEHPNRRKLTVVDVKNNEYGQLKELVVDIIRAEGNVTKEGTQLSAEQINEAVRKIVKEELAKAGISASTMPVWISNTSVATTEFVWNVLKELGYNKIAEPVQPPQPTNPSYPTPPYSGNSGS